MKTETWRDRFDERFPLKVGAQSFSGKAAKDFISAELLLLVEGLEKEKVEWQHPLSADIDVKAAHNTALDLAISHLKEAAK